MTKLRLAQIADLIGMKRHALNARLSNHFDKAVLNRTASNQILLNPNQVRELIDDKIIKENNIGHILYIGNLKGGVGKTTLSYLLSTALNSIGIKTCIIDLDVQSNLTNQYLNNHDPKAVFYDLINGSHKLNELIIKVSDCLDIIPSSLKNSLIEKTLTVQKPKHYISWFNKLCINELRSKYEIIIVDTPPSLSTLNSVFTLCLNSTDHIIIPVNPEEFSIMGVQMFLEDVNEIRTSYQLDHQPIIKIIMNKFFQNQKTNLEVLIKMGKLFGDTLSDNVIKDSAKLREIINEKQKISDIKKGKEIYETIHDILIELNILKPSSDSGDQ